jgi:hypothetical protein
MQTEGFQYAAALILIPHKKNYKFHIVQHSIKGSVIQYC